MSSAMNVFALRFLGFISVTTCARLSLNQQHAVDIHKGYGWVKDESKYICMMKWSKTFVKRGDRNQWCLVNFQQVKDALKKGVKTKEYKMKVSLRWGQCQSEEKKWAMNLCDLKGTKDVRVSFSSLRQVPKACFRISAENFTPDGQRNVDIFEAAISASDCNHIIRRPDVGTRGKFVPTPTPVPPTLAPPTTTPAIATTTTFTTITSATAITTSDAGGVTKTTTTTTTIKSTTSTTTTTTTTTTPTTSIEEPDGSSVSSFGLDDSVSENVAVVTASKSTTATTSTTFTTTSTITTALLTTATTTAKASTTTTTSLVSTITSTSSITSVATDELHINSKDEIVKEAGVAMASTKANLIPEDGAREMQVSQDDADEDEVGLDAEDGNEEIGMEKLSVSSEEEDANEAIDEEKPPTPSDAKDEDTVEMNAPTIQNVFEFWRKKDEEAQR